MNTFNRLLIILFLLILALASVAVCVSLVNFEWLEGTFLHLRGHPQTVSAAFAGIGQAIERRTIQWQWGSVGVLVVSLVLLGLEVHSARGEKTFLLHRDARGTTALDVSALVDLVRWAAEGTEGVEGMPIARVHRHGRTLTVTGVALLSPYVNAQGVIPILQQNVQTSVCKASGFPVIVRLRSRFQDPRVRRKPK